MTDRYENIRKALAMLAEHAGAGKIVDAARAATTIREMLGVRDQLAAALAAVRKDTERWRFCVEHGVMPVIANDGTTWCMFVAITGNRRSLFTGKTPAEAVDAAIDQARGKAGEEVEGG